MKNIFVFPVILILIGSNIFAQKYESKTSRIAERIFLNNRSEIDEASVGHHPHPRNMGFQQAVQLKSAQTIKQRLDSSEFQAWNDTTKLWMNYSKRINTYDAYGNNSQSLGYVWIEATQRWIPDWKIEISYTESGNISQYLTYEWDMVSNQWIPDWKDVYSYDANGIMPQIIDYDWDKTNNKWVLTWQYLYTYNDNGDVTQILEYYRDEPTFQWVAAWKYNYSFDDKSQQTQQLEYFLDENTSEWVADSKIEYFYDENENMSEYRVYNRNQGTDQLELDWKREYTYDNRYSHTDLVSYLSSFWQNHMLTSQLTSMWNKSTNEWEHPIYKTSYYYSELNTTSFTGLNQNQFNIYPNPVTEYVQFDFQNINSEVILELFDIHSRKLLSKTIYDNEKVNMMRFRSGTYIYKLNIDGKIQSGKLIKE